MSNSFDGKIVNQFPKYKSASIICICAKCNKIVPNPKKLHLQDDKRVYIVNSYLQEPYYIYETNSGRAVVYCSKYCMKKHNHRFNTVKKKHHNDEIIERVEKALKNKDQLCLYTFTIEDSHNYSLDEIKKSAFNICVDNAPFHELVSDFTVEVEKSNIQDKETTIYTVYVWEKK